MRIFAVAVFKTPGFTWGYVIKLWFRWFEKYYIFVIKSVTEQSTKNDINNYLIRRQVILKFESRSVQLYRSIFCKKVLYNFISMNDRVDLKNKENLWKERLVL